MKLKNNPLLKKLGGIALSFAVLCTSCTPSFAATGSPDTSVERSLTIHKYHMEDMSHSTTEGTGQQTDVVPADAIPLPGIQFKVTKMQDTDHTKVDSTWNIQTVTTGADGSVTIRGNSNLPMGVYKVEEQTNPAVAVKADPCLVSVPLTNPTGDGWIYNVHVFPKNKIKPGPEIDKFVTELENKHDTADISESVKWIIETTLPDDVATCKDYTVTDTIDTRLDYVPGSLKVYRVDTSKNRVLMTPDCYTVTEPNTANSRTLTVQLTAIGKQTAAKSLPNKEDVSATLNLEFNTLVNKTAEGSLGQPIPNGATIHYTNNLDIVFEPQSVKEKPEVHTGGVNLLKVDSEDNTVKLQGAKFKVYRTEADAKKNINAVKDPANNSVDWEVTTDTNGIAHFWGLAYGKKGQDAYYGDSTNYWVVETQSPVDTNGKPYNLLKYPVKVTVNSNSHNDANRIVIENIKHYDLPYTGGVGNMTPLYIGAVLILLAGGATVILVRRHLQEKKR
ncbi:isopeptide-forming domain-containing fimbrial protein [Eubacterium sp. AM05-23]|uniref:SpaH/EbpB family LPXTG-anchored major pilin n=1 Tax=Eubacterium TaxID=1730 RepID=UPI000E526E38|nr:MULTISPECIES: SpaH/EbpB family LPXTG-anchored major pilin [Eubacterium]RHO59550.1 isopeptide-forming domain-containing fimbrial protein [Eubacterium sp. AM05-23]